MYYRDMVYGDTGYRIAGDTGQGSRQGGYYYI
jgi:hypothetical protein